MTAADTQILLNKLQSNINQLELTNKGALNALEFRLDAILQSNLDTFWLLICAILVFLMQAGFMCLETGLSRSKNSINVALKNVADFGISVVVFWAFGFALMYGTSVLGLFGTKFFFFTTKVAGYQTYFVFQAMFVATAATIISGAVAERLKFFSYIIITLLVSGFFYPIVGHWSWAFNFDNPAEKFGWLGQLGYLDFAGASVVHSVGGWIALSVLLVVGNRTGRFREDDKKKSFQGSNTPMAALGALILWFGWFGFNAGSELAADGIAVNAFLTTNTAAAMAALTWMVIGGLHTGKISAVGAATGAIAGLVAITPACGFVDVGGALMIGLSASIVCYMSALLMEKSRIDDALVVFGVHGVGGAWGALMTGVFASEVIGGVPGVIEGNPALMVTQIIPILATFLYSGVVTFIILKVLDIIPGLGLQEDEKSESQGLDISTHAERGYIADGAD